MIILSCFDGIRCGRVALERAGIHVEKYYSSEIDKYANIIGDANYPDTISLGDITKWREWDIDWCAIDLLMGGSPCQGFSFAGKQLAFDDPRSALFFEYVNILNHIRKHNPQVKFLLENVRMKKEYLDEISRLLGVEPVCINSALVSAQNRVRYYWCNWGVDQPEDKGILLNDILECKVDEKYIQGDGWHKWWEKNSKFQLGKKYSSLNADKAITMTARQYASWNGNFIYPASIVGRRINKIGKREDYNKNVPVTQCLQVKYSNDKTGCLTTVQKDNVVTGMNPGRYVDCYSDVDVFYRRLTPIECERLQTVPDGFTSFISNTQRYKALGNGWTVDVVAHIFKSMYK